LTKANTKTIVIHAYNLEVYLFDFIQSGILGALANNNSEEYLIQAIRKAAMGEILFSQDQIDQARIWKEIMTDKWTQLTDRERLILELLNAGLSNKEIALSLEITTKTISFHTSNIFRKLGVNSRLEAASWVTNYLKKTH
jgi:DNA-binding NarL/FixJ family response regulator